MLHTIYLNALHVSWLLEEEGVIYKPELWFCYHSYGLEVSIASIMRVLYVVSREYSMYAHSIVTKYIYMYIVQYLSAVCVNIRNPSIHPFMQWSVHPSIHSQHVL